MQGGLWVTAIHDKTNDLFIFPCPNDYCRCFHQNDSSSPSTRCIITYTEDAQDEQCHCEREGTHLLSYLYIYWQLLVWLATNLWHYPPTQCKGVLCGNCKNGTGFSALLDKCVHCNYANIGFIIALCKELTIIAQYEFVPLLTEPLSLSPVIADALVITILLVLKVGPPAWIYPSLFYLQVTKLACSSSTYSILLIASYSVYNGYLLMHSPVQHP